MENARAAPCPSRLWMPRPWVTRRRGECAYPVAGRGADTLSCCRPSGPAQYCPGHLDRMRGPQDPSFEDFIIALKPWIG